MVRWWRRRGRSGRRLRQWLALAVLAVGLMVVPSSAWAGPEWCEAESAPVPVKPGFGTSALMMDPGAASQHLYESQLNSVYTPEQLGSAGEFQQRGMVWHVIVTEDCFDGNRFSFWDAIYNPIWNFSLELNNMAMNAYMASTADTVAITFHDFIEDVTAQLRDSLWRPLLPTMAILGSLVLMWYAFVRKQATLTLQGALWMVVSTALGMWMLFSPGFFLKLSTDAVTFFNGIVTSATANIQIPGMTERCPADADLPQKHPEESVAMFNARVNAQTYWEGMMCRPYFAGMWGTGDNANALSEEHGTALLRASTITYAELESEDYGDLVENKRTEYENITEAVRGTEDVASAEYRVFSGSDGPHRLGVAVGALAGSLTGGAMVLAAALALFAFRFTFVILFLLAPVFLLLGILPGWGRVRLIRWGELLVGLVLKQGAVILLLNLLVLMLGVIMGIGMPWGMQIFAMAGLMVGALFAWRPMWAMMSANPSFERAVGTPKAPGILRNLAQKGLKVGAAIATGGSTLAAATGLPYAGAARSAASQGLGRRTARAGAAAGKQLPAGLTAGETDARWGAVMDPRRATDGTNGDAPAVAAGGRLARIRDAMGQRPSTDQWRQDNPVLAGFEAHRWQGMSRSERRHMARFARSNPDDYVKVLGAEREQWAARARTAKRNAAPPLTPHQAHRVGKAASQQQQLADAWARKGAGAGRRR